MTLQHLFEDQEEWSSDTFGDHKTIKGVINHMQREFHEIAKNPSDKTEWADMIILCLDALWRGELKLDEDRVDLYHYSGHNFISTHHCLGYIDRTIWHDRTPDFNLIIGTCMKAIEMLGGHPLEVVAKKQEVNRNRVWPDKSEQNPDEAIEHVR